jgi:putative glutamine amidotransferase
MATDSRPLLIGASARIYYPGTQASAQGVFTKTLHYLEQSVAHWLLSGHAMAVMVPAVTRDSIVTRSDLTLPDYARALDGLVLQGGNDVAPESYGETPLHPDWAGDRVRDRYEIELVQAFVQAGKPVFGICRGLQLLNVMFGGTLLQDIPTQRPGARAHREPGRYERHYHDIEIEPGSRLAALYPDVRRAVTNNIHTRPSRTWRPASSSRPAARTTARWRRSGAAKAPPTWPRSSGTPSSTSPAAPTPLTTPRCSRTFCKPAAQRGADPTLARPPGPRPWPS